MPYKDKEVENERRRELWHNRTPEQMEKRRERERIRAQLPEQKQRRLATKIEVLTYYGKGILACVICGEVRLACLSIDHIDNNGAEERKSRIKYGFNVYKHLKSQGFPKGYQTLCMNCQFIKAHEYHY